MGVTEEQIKLRALSFSLKDSAKDCFYYLPSGSVITWNEMNRLFLEKYFPASRADNIRKEICGIKQYNGESLHEYWERFKKLCASCPHHQISEQLLIQYFYEGLQPTDKSMIDAASGGALVDKTPEAVRNLIANMAANSQLFGYRLGPPSKHANEACGICSVVGHPTDMCPTLQEEPVEQVNVVGGFPGQPQRKYDPYLSTYNPGWRDHPNLSYGNPQNHPSFLQYHLTFQQYQPHPPRQQPTQNSDSGMSLEDIVKSLATKTLQFQHETRASIQRLDNQMGQMATAISRLEAQSSGKLPSQMVVKPKENVSAIILRSGKEVEAPARAAPALSNQEKEKDITPDGDEVPKRKFPPLSDYKSVLPFPNALAGSRKNEQFKDFYETFRRYEANMPLFNALNKKQKLKGCEKVRVGENVSAIIQRKLPTKCKDPSMFTIPCMIGNIRIEKAMLDLGASIKAMIGNIRIEKAMPYSIYASLKLGPLNKTGVVIQLANRSNAYIKGVVEDVLVKTKIDVYSGTLTKEFDGQIVKFNIYDAMNYPTDDNPICSVDAIDSLAQEVFELNENDGLEVSIIKHLEKEEPMLKADLRPLPFVLQAPIPELKPLPNHLKHVFLGDRETLQVIMSSSLSAPQEEKLVQVLTEHKTTIGWTIMDIKGINPSTCMHRILLEEQEKPLVNHKEG
ncbi:PREDICTED: uncharacterized protein LOC104588349 [Nelumbo nucifera]|uniref:Uncharacterized protein LOC104588349 n=1 Tax=Nelumbo nucifera TaxID=4432 RepID=A0A1U7YY93_NELNU|nr:PREDICTED: uncharacterized protein LOC104588349 [Nelumbo nucifera]